MSEGIEWIQDAWQRGGNDFYITCARGLSPRALAERMSDHEPVQILSGALNVDQAAHMVDLDQVYCVARVGTCGEWSYVVESGGSEGCFLDPEVSKEAEVLVFDPQPDHPPAQFLYHRDGQVVINSSLSGAERFARGADDLVEAMERVEEAEDTSQEEVRGLLRVIGEYFDLSLPKNGHRGRRTPSPCHTHFGPEQLVSPSVELGSACERDVVSLAPLAREAAAVHPGCPCPARPSPRARGAGRRCCRAALRAGTIPAGAGSRGPG